MYYIMENCCESQHDCFIRAAAMDCLEASGLERLAWPVVKNEAALVAVGVPGAGVE